MANARTFAIRLRRRAENLERNASREIRAAGLAMLQGLILATPVDTGRARSNWLVGLNTPRRDQSDEEGRSGNEAISKGSQVIAAVEADDDVWISNNLPYIGRLNEGSSPQAPPGFVEDTVNAVADRVNVNARLLD